MSDSKLNTTDKTKDVGLRQSVCYGECLHVVLVSGLVNPKTCPESPPHILLPRPLVVICITSLEGPFIPDECFLSSWHSTNKSALVWRCQSTYMPKRPVPHPVPTGNLHQFVGRPFHRSQVLSVFMLLNQTSQLGCGAATCCFAQRCTKVGNMHSCQTQS